MKNKFFKKPNFFIVGFPKSGTTSVYHWLRQHPDIFMPSVKEPYFFAPEIIKFIQSHYGGKIDFINYYFNEDYFNLFSDRKEKMLGEASVMYVCLENVPNRMKNFFKGKLPKIIILVRNPVDAVFSLFNDFYTKDFGVEFEDFKFRWEEGVRNNLWKIYNIYEHSKRFVDVFGRENVQIVLFDDLINNPEKTYREILHFLGVDPIFVPDFVRHNESIKIKIRLVRKIFLFYSVFPEILRGSINILVPKRIRLFLTSLSHVKGKNLEYTSSLRKEVVDYYRLEIDKFSKLIKRNLSHWKR